MLIFYRYSGEMFNGEIGDANVARAERSATGKCEPFYRAALRESRAKRHTHY
jgi:hypothetical protein